MDAKTLGASKRPGQNQSMVPSVPTSAAVRRSPMSPCSAIVSSSGTTEPPAAVRQLPGGPRAPRPLLVRLGLGPVVEHRLAHLPQAARLVGVGEERVVALEDVEQEPLVGLERLVVGQLLAEVE